MRGLAVLGVAVALGVWSAPALAFEETPIPGVSIAQPGSSEAPAGSGAAAEPDIPSLTLADPSSEPSSGSGGTNVAVPGLGSIGVLPKLDFGLELLYGKSEPTAEEPAGSSDDLSVGGRVRHTF